MGGLLKVGREGVEPPQLSQRFYRCRDSPAPGPPEPRLIGKAFGSCCRRPKPSAMSATRAKSADHRGAWVPFRPLGQAGSAPG